MLSAGFSAVIMALVEPAVLLVISITTKDDGHGAHGGLGALAGALEIYRVSSVFFVCSSCQVKNVTGAPCSMYVCLACLFCVPSDAPPKKNGLSKYPERANG